MILCIDNRMLKLIVFEDKEMPQLAAIGPKLNHNVVSSLWCVHKYCLN
jgi:hypothetical protein